MTLRRPGQTASPPTATARSSAWAGSGGEGAKYWQTILTGIKNNGA